ncbi:unnamed protein product [Gongylonema pulchrum]|uniref:Protein AATF-like n=1 Tax=Gongylonema pulchrum TaxID=637853 RepID=A0A183DVG1_9BILA|nr:unnamed protein product [Gongylonema pulchrum]
MSQRRQYRRVVIDDSSSSDEETNTANNDKRKELDESDGKSDDEFQDLNQSLEKLKLSFKKKFTCYGQQVNKTDDELTSSENTYVEDSFCVKDSLSEVTSSSAWSEEKSPSENPENIPSPKESEKASAVSRFLFFERKKKTADYSTYFKSDFLDEGDADAKISTLLELYPELKENADPAR